MGQQVADRNFSDKAVLSVCYAPFVSLEFHPDGGARVCCQNQEIVVGKIPEQTIDEIWHGQVIRDLRHSLRNYSFSKGCARCLWRFEHDMTREVPRATYDDFQVTEEYVWPQVMVFRLHNTCNLACVMCEPYASSRIAKERGLPQWPRKYGSEFFEQLRVFLPHLVRAEFSGGEPFLIREHYRVLDLLIELNPDVEIVVTTNATVLNKRVKAYLEQLRFNHITLSLDATTKQRFEAIRRGALFDDVMANAHYFSQYARQASERTLHLSFCAMRQNWDEIPSVLLLAEELQAHLVLQIVTFPQECVLFTLSPTELSKIQQSLEHSLNRLQGVVSPENLASVRELISAISRARHINEGGWPTVFRSGAS